jgi:hypothetical protein
MMDYQGFQFVMDLEMIKFSDMKNKINTAITLIMGVIGCFFLFYLIYILLK